MLQFRRGPGARNYLARREQYRLFALVALLGGIVWIAMIARNPQHYRWLWGWGRGESAENEQVDTRVPMSDAPALDTFVFPPPGETLADSTSSTSDPLTEADLATVRDDEPFRAGEQGAWFKLLARLQSTDPAVLARQSTGPVTFIQLYRQPKEYRAELVTIAGTLRRSEEIAAPKNDLGIATYYRTWVFPNDNPANPIIVYTLTVPDGFPSGMTLEEQVELDGFFFKRYPYAATDTIRSAPVVLAGSLRWFATEPDETAPPVSPAMMVGVAAAMAAAFVVFVWWRTRPARREEPRADVIAALNPDKPAGDTASHLRLLADQEQESEP